jgi:hypothetical protein
LPRRDEEVPTRWDEAEPLRRAIDERRPEPSLKPLQEAAIQRRN